MPVHGTLFLHARNAEDAKQFDALQKVLPIVSGSMEEYACIDIKFAGIKMHLFCDKKLERETDKEE